MIHDKDYIIRIVRNFSAFLSKLLLEKNEGELPEQQRLFDTQMNDVFKMNFETLSSKTKEEILEIVNSKEPHHQADYLELLGHLFYVKGKEIQNKDLLDKAKYFYELYLQKSGIFSLPIINRINELK